MLIEKIPLTLAFDVYGTLIDTNGVIQALQKIVGNRAKLFARDWRNKQLEYTFRRGLMKKYENLNVCISNALDYTCAFYNTNLDKVQKNELLELYCSLPAFEDVKKGLSELQTDDFRTFAFSNGTPDTVELLLNRATIRDFFLEIVSVDELKSFKPNPAVYSYFLERTGATCDRAWLISSNPFDVIGAISAGMKAAWIQRSYEECFDPWEIGPTITVSSLFELKEKITEFTSIT